MTGMNTSKENRRIGCIFDADGTLLDSMGFWQALPQRFLESRQIAAPADISKVLADMSLPESCAYLHQQYLSERSTKDIRQEITAMIRQAYSEQITLKPGVLALLSGLQEKGIVMCVASTSDQLLLEMCFQRLGIASFFEAVITPEKENMDKSGPDLYVRGETVMHTAAFNTYVFEDTLLPVRTAKKAGYRVIAVRDVWSRSDWPLMEETADLCVDGLMERDKIFTFMGANKNSKEF